MKKLYFIMLLLFFFSNNSPNDASARATSVQLSRYKEMTLTLYPAKESFYPCRLCHACNGWKC